MNDIEFFSLFATCSSLFVLKCTFVIYDVGWRPSHGENGGEGEKNKCTFVSYKSFAQA